MFSGDFPAGRKCGTRRVGGHMKMTNIAAAVPEIPEVTQMENNVQVQVCSDKQRPSGGRGQRR